MVYRFLLLSCLVLAGCDRSQHRSRTFHTASIIAWERTLAEVIRKDIFSPPQAARIFGYAQIALYEAMLPAYPGHRSLAGQVKDLRELPAPPDTARFDAELAALTAYMRTAQAMVYDEQALERYHRHWLDSLSVAIGDEHTIHASLEYGHRVAEAVKAWAAKDMFKETRSMVRHTVLGNDSVWQPTPPDFMSAFEPHWGRIRTFVIDSMGTRRDLPIPPFSTDTSSILYKEAVEVQAVGAGASDSLAAIAWYWDDNPNTTLHSGHVMIKVQKHSPPAHWMLIAGQVSLEKGHDAIQTAQTLAMTAMAVHDAVVSCWHCKYKYNTIRPVTYIGRYIDPDWDPLLDTPPFPENPSGHSAISRAAAVVLTHRIGAGHGFVDIAEEQFGLGRRSFTDMLAAAEEAKMSRLYGGIHFRSGNEFGAMLGDSIGRAVSQKIRFQ